MKQLLNNILEVLHSDEYLAKSVVSDILSGKIQLSILSLSDIYLYFMNKYNLSYKEFRSSLPISKVRPISPVGFNNGNDLIIIRKSSNSNMIYLLGHEIYHLTQRIQGIEYPTDEYLMNQEELKADAFGRKLQKRILKKSF